MSIDSDWYDNTKPAKELRRAAANRFLEAVLVDANHLGVAGFDNHAEARKQFQTLGMPLPPNVHVICVEADTHNMADLVVFVLRKKPEAGRAELWRKRWVAAWQPY